MSGIGMITQFFEEKQIDEKTVKNREKWDKTDVFYPLKQK